MAGKNNWKERQYIPMKLLRCNGVLVWGNPSKPNTWRCTRCGKEHD